MPKCKLRKLRELLGQPKAFIRDSRIGRWRAISSPPQPARKLGDVVRVLTLSFDDSTLFVADAFARLVSTDASVKCYSARLRTSTNADFLEISETDEFLGRIGTHGELYSLDYLKNFDALFFAKVPPRFATHLRRSRFLDAPDRPLLISAFPGLELTPDKGFRNRLFCDVIVFNTTSDRAVFSKLYGSYAEQKSLLVGHPSIVLRHTERHSTRSDGTSSRKIAFLAQNITPPTLEGRAALLKLLAKRDRQEPIFVKSRQRHGHNAAHVHTELFSYESISATEAIPIDIVHSSMNDALLRYEKFISCSSTGLFEAAAKGHSVGFIVKFNGWTQDVLHIRGLGYATRYKLAVDPEKDGPLALRKTNSNFRADFGLLEESPEWPLRQLLCDTLAKMARAGETTQWQRALAMDIPVVLAVKAYEEFGNSHKALFLSLAEASSAPTISKSEIANILRLARKADTSGTLLRELVTPVLQSISNESRQA